MGIADFGRGATDALQQILQEEALKAFRSQQMAAEQTRLLQSQERLGLDREQLGEGRRQFDLGRSDDQAKQSVVAAERARVIAAAEAEKRAKAEAAAAFLQANPHLRTVVEAQGVGLNTEDPHKLESPDVHAPHLRAESDAKWGERRRELDYREQQLRTRPERPMARFRLAPGADDPALPRGVQDYLVALRSKYGSFDEAAREFSGAIGLLRRDHPSLDTAKALGSLRVSFSGARPAGATTGNPRVQSFVSSVLNEAGGEAPQRADGPAGPHAQVDGGATERVRAAIRTKIGREPSDAEVQRVIADPKNRHLFGGGR